MIPIADLRDHPRNSNRHGDRQLEVLATRWRALGWYKNVVVAEWEGTTTLLAGHGIVAGARAAGATEAPCHVREIDPLSPEALDILEGDNTVADLAEPDLHERLRNLVELDAAGRLGNVGYDDGALDRLKAELQAEDFVASQGPPVEDPGPMGRVCYGVEIEPRYVDVAVRRWQQATGQTAILESTGEPFPDVT